MADDLPVEQRHRDAAAEIASAIWGEHSGDHYRNGMGDSHSGMPYGLTQAFACFEASLDRPSAEPGKKYKLPVRHEENYSGEHRDWIVEYTLPDWLVAEIQADSRKRAENYGLHEAIVEQGGHRSILLLEEMTGNCIKSFSNGYEQPDDKTWLEARAYLEGWCAALSNQ